jgi:hypothetical protein
MSILIFCPTARLEPETVEAIFAQDYDGPVDYLFTRDNPRGNAFENQLYNLERMREIFLAGTWEAVWMVESDIIPPPDGLRKLLSHAGGTVSGLYAHRHGPPRPNLMRWQGNTLSPMEWHEVLTLPADGHGVIWTAGTCFGCVLIRRYVMERILFRLTENQAPDWAWMLDMYCQPNAHYAQLADLTIRCGHKRPDGLILWVGESGVEYERPGAKSKMLHVAENEFVSGIPARDLTNAEWEALPPDARRHAMASRVYAEPRPVAR